MKILVVLNNHNSISILDLCFSLQKTYQEISYFSVMDSGFYFKFKDLIEKHDIENIIFSNRLQTLKFNRPKKINNEFNDQEKVSPFKKNILTQIKSKIFTSSTYLFIREWIITTKMVYYKIKASKLLSRTNPDIILSISDRTYDYVEAPIHWAAKKKGVPIILTYANQFDINASLELRKNLKGETYPNLSSNTFLSIYKSLANRLIKNQIINNTFYQNSFVLMSARKSGFLSKNSWWVGNGLCDKVLVDSNHSKKKYLKNGVPASKIHIAGHPDYDIVYQSYKNRIKLKRELCFQNNLEERKPLVIFALPQFAEQGTMSWAKHWDIISKNIESIVSLEVNLFLSLHPRMNPENYKFLEEKFNCNFLKDKLSKSIGCSDVFLASNSTVLSWSILCDIKTIVIFSPAKDLIKHLNSIYYEPDPNKLKNLLKNILKDKTSRNYLDFKELSREKVFFGKSLDSHYSFFIDVIKNFKY